MHVAWYKWRRVVISLGGAENLKKKIENKLAFKGIKVHNLILFYVVFKKLQDAFYRF